MNAYNPDHHDKLANHYDCLDMYQDLLIKHHNPTSWLKRYRLLNYAVWKKKMALTHKTGKGVTAKAPNEGNHRLNAIEYTVMGSIFDNSPGLIHPGTLTTEWIAKQLAGLKELDVKKIKENMDNAIENMDETIEKAMKNEESMLNAEFTYINYYGKTKAEISKLGDCMEYIHSRIKRNSENLSIHKTESVTPKENTNIASGCENFLTLLETNSKPMELNEHASFSANGACYFEYNPKDLQPLDCWDSPEGKKFLSNPNLDTMKRFSHTINCGVVNAGKTSITGVMNKVVHPPQHLNVVSLALGNGHYKQKSKKKIEQYLANINNGGDKIIGQRPKDRIERGEAHYPLGIEDMNRAMLVASIWRPIFRAFHRIEERNQEKNPLFSQQKLELQFLVESQCFTYLAGNQMGNSGPRAYSEKWREIMGTKSIFHKHSIHMSAALGIAEICLSFLMLPDMGVEKTREFVSFIKTAHNDSPDYDDREFVRIIGK